MHETTETSIANMRYPKSPTPGPTVASIANIYNLRYYNSGIPSMRPVSWSYRNEFSPVEFHYIYGTRGLISMMQYKYLRRNSIKVKNGRYWCVNDRTFVQPVSKICHFESISAPNPPSTILEVSNLIRRDFLAISTCICFNRFCSCVLVFL